MIYHSSPSIEALPASIADVSMYFPETGERKLCQSLEEAVQVLQSCPESIERNTEILQLASSRQIPGAAELLAIVNQQQQ